MKLSFSNLDRPLQQFAPAAGVQFSTFACNRLTFDSAGLTLETRPMNDVSFEQITCLRDNYCVLLRDNVSGEALAIDAPEATPIERALTSNKVRLADIFITHHHNDHTGGCLALQATYRCRITGPAAEAERIPGLTSAVSEASSLSFAGHEVRVLETPGHTLGHVSYYFPSLATVFTGDTLFALGCGRLFEGDPQMMHASLQKIAALPDETTIYCGHEYTLANARFAVSIEPENEALAERLKTIDAKRAKGESTLPTTVGLEKRTNPFLRTQSAAIRSRLGLAGAPDWQVLARLRELKNKA
jgi:hydroxyacylglutathione hydrolase